MTLDSTGTTGINRIRDATGDERADLEGEAQRLSCRTTG